MGLLGIGGLAAAEDTSPTDLCLALGQRVEADGRKIPLL